MFLPKKGTSLKALAVCVTTLKRKTTKPCSLSRLSDLIVQVRVVLKNTCLVNRSLSSVIAKVSMVLKRQSRTQEHQMCKTKILNHIRETAML